MIEELMSPQQEEAINRKVKAKKRMRGLLIVINAVLACYFIFELTMKITDSIQKAHDNEGEVICLNDLNMNDSLKIYDKYVSKDINGNYRTTDIYDFGIYGDYLHLSSLKIEPSAYSTFSTLALINTTSNVSFSSEMNTSIDGNYLNGGIKLSSLSEGDYIVLDTILTQQNYSSTHRAVKIRSLKGVNKTIYTLPDANNQRKKITIKSKETSPSLVISVDNVESLPQDYYDFVLFGEGSKTNAYLNELPADLKIYQTALIEDAYVQKANYCIGLDDSLDKPIVSHLLKDVSDDFNKDEMYGGESSIASQDQHALIRELGGHLTSSGAMIQGDENTFLTRPYIDSFDLGKYVIITPEIFDYQKINELIS